VRRAQDAVLKTRPFSETLQKVLGGLIVRLKKDNFDSPLMSERPVNKVTNIKAPEENRLLNSWLLLLGGGIPTRQLASGGLQGAGCGGVYLAAAIVGVVSGCITLGGGCKERVGSRWGV
jgi:hypothetical protein